ncbi:MGH1-like glycoside hydrolase domain-containing protein [Limnovirga soli]|uniref:Glucosidase n=1 Tax=Limnovirga soli TaxID=2656915 RepID=A0A8J8FEU4_9BACT|nr:glucosidase [Limnovirga soli]NNV55478.1 glucosidase [Limnovirga soli]
MTAEQQRLKANAGKKIPLEQWGPYVSDRQWGTVREDYSENSDAWNYFPFNDSHCRAYRWGEDGIGGISDFFQSLCFSVALWNGKDTVLKERLFGLGNYEGNHGEDVKELYYYLDNTPTHYYMQMLYKYPQAAFPYEQLREENRKRTKLETEYELLDTGVFDDNKYFDVLITYAKYSKTDIAIKIDITNRGKTTAPITVLPTLWFYNRWQTEVAADNRKKPLLKEINEGTVRATHERLGAYYLYYPKTVERYFTENETNTEKLYNKPNITPFTKDAINNAVIDQINVDQLKKNKTGTKFSPVYKFKIPGGSTKTICLRLSNVLMDAPFSKGFDQIFNQRKKEADEFYADVLPKNASEDLKNIQRQALAGLLWSKQYYHYDIENWLSVNDGIAHVSDQRKNGRNHQWLHLKNQDVLLMPDKWEYPWYAAWDLAFHCIPMALIDPTFAKHQLILMMREWYMKPDGQLPAYEWNFSDVNPPVHAWSALQVYHIEKKKTGKGDIDFLKRTFQKLIINFTWWINRKDPNGNNIFEGGFLGLDNIGVFNRSIQLHSEMELEQADGTSWMGMYALNLMDMAIEIAMHDISFEDTATKFFEHFVLIAEALNEMGLWNNEDKFFYDVLGSPGNKPIQLRIQSIVGLTSLFAVSVIERKVMHQLEDFSKRISWFENYRIKNNKFWPNEEHDEGEKTLLSLVPKDKLIALLQRLVSEAEFLSDGGIRALSKYHEANPYSVNIQGTEYSIGYDPGDSTSDFFGGNSNWRGPVWMPINYLIIQSIKKFGEFYEGSLTIEYPTGSGIYMELGEVANELVKRIVTLFKLDEKNNRRLHAEYNWFYSLPENKDLVLYYEYFNGDTGRGLGAAHQTGWTALIAELINELAEKQLPPSFTKAKTYEEED